MLIVQILPGVFKLHIQLDNIKMVKINIIKINNEGLDYGTPSIRFIFHGKDNFAYAEGELNNDLTVRNKLKVGDEVDIIFFCLFYRKTEIKEKNFFYKYEDGEYKSNVINGFKGEIIDKIGEDIYVVDCGIPLYIEEDVKERNNLFGKLNIGDYDINSP